MPDIMVFVNFGKNLILIISIWGDVFAKRWPQARVMHVGDMTLGVSGARVVGTDRQMYEDVSKMGAASFFAIEKIHLR